MYLSKLEILGFKSFAQKIKLNFNDGLTCIIGPNGSGKSNIVDAIRWVLGEQRVSSLRSDKMENVIFNGTKLRKPMGMSEVSMTIENNKKILDSEYDEIVISRRLYRSGESQYLINKVPVRLKDVVNLFMDTGMGANSYSVIELKMVESILSENKQERRQLFEEAAGVVKYKTRRKSALRKLESTQHDLERINDIIIEVDKTVSSLGRQVSKARRYLDLTEQLKKSDIDLAVFRYHKLKDQINPLEQELLETSKEKEESHHQITLEEAILEDYNRQLVKYEQQLQVINKDLYDKDNVIRQLNQEDAIADAKIEEMKKNRERYTVEIEEFSKKINLFKDEIVSYESELTDLNQDSDNLQTEFNRVSKERDEESAMINAEKAEIDKLNSQFREQLQKVTQQKEQLQQKEYRINFNKEQIEKIKTINTDQSDEIANLEQQIKSSEEKKSNSEEQLFIAEKSIEDLKLEAIDHQDAVNKKQTEYNNVLSDLERIKSRENFFQNIISNYEGHSKSTQFVMSKKTQFPGVFGPIADLIEADEKDAFLVESILKESINYIVVDQVATARSLINQIKNENLGRITCIPLDRVNDIKRPQAPSDNDLNFLINRLKSSSQVEHLLNILLGDVVVVESLDKALTLSEKHPSLRFISAEGEMVNFNREISGGKTDKKDTAIVGRKNKLKELKSEREKLETVIETLKDEIAELQLKIEQNRNRQKDARDQFDSFQREFYSIDNTIKQLNYQLSTRHKQIEAAGIQSGQLEEQIAQTQSEMDALKKEIDFQQQELNALERETISRTNSFETKNEQFQILLEEYQSIQLKLSNARNQVQNRQNDLNRHKTNITELENSIRRRTEEIETIRQSLINFDNDIADRKTKREQIWVERDEKDKERELVETEFQELKDKRHKLENQIREFRRKHDNSLEKSKKLEIKISEYNYRSESIRTYASKEYGTDVDAHLPNENLDENETEELIDSLKNRIKNLGPVNPLAVSEHEKESERLEFLTTQRNDLLKAEESLLETIDKINKTARDQFQNTFTEIKNNFEKVFGSFFPNGRGTLLMDESKDPLEADIEIEVTTKGRGLQTLSLLSGGEKTLTAISLLFSIYLVKPSPFCILDEVDAPLDDVNIGRFTEALKGFSNNTQFIVVTHNKRTMEAAQTMYGVTMEEEGVSKIVSVQFN